MQFVFSGFKQNLNVRQFLFVGIAEDRTRSPFWVCADLTLLRKHQISLQDAPLLCLHLLESTGLPPVQNSVTFSEEDMQRYSASRLADREAALQKRKHPKTAPDPTRLGAAWRTKPQV